MVCKTSRQRPRSRSFGSSSSIGVACAAGVFALGCGSDSKDGPVGPPSVVGSSLDGNSLVVRFANTRGAYSLTCEGAMALVKASGEPWVNESPACGAGAYFLDGELHDNQSSVDCATCTEGICVPFAPETTFSIAERFSVGFLSMPDAGAASASDAGAEADSGLGGSLPAYETRPYPGPYQLAVRYHAESSCAGPLVETAAVTLEPTN
jgi:hypothetical protein